MNNFRKCLVRTPNWLLININNLTFDFKVFRIISVIEIQNWKIFIIVYKLVKPNFKSNLILILSFKYMLNNFCFIEFIYLTIINYCCWNTLFLSRQLKWKKRKEKREGYCQPLEHYYSSILIQISHMHLINFKK